MDIHKYVLGDATTPSSCSTTEAMAVLVFTKTLMLPQCDMLIKATLAIMLFLRKYTQS